jgi:hypothetical protein
MRVTLGGFKIERTCKWIGMTTRRIFVRCQIPAVAKNCPVTCGICAL